MNKTEQYPVLEIHGDIIKQNAQVLLNECRSIGIEPCAVVKGFCNLMPITKELCRAGFKEAASSRVAHLKEIREAGLPVSTLLLRIPMACEIPDVVRYCDAALVSEPETIRQLDQEAAAQKKLLNVILMRDLGDLREGIFDRETFVRTAVWIEEDLEHLHLKGIGTNLTCYGSVMPTEKNLGELCENAKQIEQLIGRKLEVVSGGNTSSLPLVLQRRMPEGINHLRIGEALIVPWDLFYTWKCPREDMSNAALILKAQIVECGEKPTMPVGEQGINCFGSYRTYEDHGIRKRAIVAIGEYDMGNYEKLVPVDPGVKVLGASSDHTIVDIHDSAREYHLGDVMSFELRYQSMLFTTANPLVRKVCAGQEGQEDE
ncbi:MAG: alanine racemase [Lachnospiraceae bacterium]|nr:alanine racemase [Lachnospiraceae bacterium]